MYQIFVTFNRISRRNDMAVTEFMVNTTGQLLRMVAGIALIIVGFFLVNGIAAYILSVVVIGLWRLWQVVSAILLY